MSPAARSRSLTYAAAARSTARRSAFAGLAGATAVVGVGLGATLQAADAPVDEAAIKEMVMDMLEDDARMGPTLVRLAWHAGGTFDKATGIGGSNGATMRFGPEAGHGANAG